MARNLSTFPAWCGLFFGANSSELWHGRACERLQRLVRCHQWKCANTLNMCLEISSGLFFAMDARWLSIYSFFDGWIYGQLQLHLSQVTRFEKNMFKVESEGLQAGQVFDRESFKNVLLEACNSKRVILLLCDILSERKTQAAFVPLSTLPKKRCSSKNLLTSKWYRWNWDSRRQSGLEVTFHFLV